MGFGRCICAYLCDCSSKTRPAFSKGAKIRLAFLVSESCCIASQMMIYGAVEEYLLSVDDLFVLFSSSVCG